MTRTRFLVLLFIGIVAAWAVTGSGGGLRSLLNLSMLVGASLAAGAAGYVVGFREGSGRRALRLVMLSVAVGLALFLLELPALLGLLDYRTLLVPKMPGGRGPHNRVMEPGILYRRPAHDRFTSKLFGDAVVIAGVATDRRYTVDYVADSKGMRNGREYEDVDIALVGDSFVEGYRVGQDQTAASRLAASTGKSVVNLGHSGWGPGNELAALERFAIPLKPEVVVWFFFEGNDLRNLDEHRIAMADFEAWKRNESRLEQRSLLANAKRVLHGLASAYGRSGDAERARRLSGEFRDANGADHRLYFTIRPFPLDERNTTLLADTCDILDAAAAKTRAIGSRFIVVFVPTKFRVYRDHCEFDELSWCRRWKLNSMPGKMSAWARKQGIEFLDLTEPLREGAARGELLFLSDDAHWNPAGENVVSEHLRTFLEE